MSGELERLRALSEAATPGPWRYLDDGEDDGGAWLEDMSEDGPRGGTLAHFAGLPNAAFVAASVSYVCDLLARDSVGAGLDVELLANMLGSWPGRLDVGGEREAFIAHIAAEYARLAAARLPAEDDLVPK